MKKAQSKEFIIFTIVQKQYGLSVNNVIDVLPVPHITKLPLAPKEILGLLSHKGKVVTAINMEMVFENTYDNLNAITCIITSYEDEYYGLIVHSVKDVVTLGDEDEIEIIDIAEVIHNILLSPINI